MVWWKSGFSMQSMEVQPGKLVRGQTTYLTVRTGSKRRDVRRRSSFLIEYPTYASQFYLGGNPGIFLAFAYARVAVCSAQTSGEWLKNRYRAGCLLPKPHGIALIHIRTINPIPNTHLSTHSTHTHSQHPHTYTTLHTYDSTLSSFFFSCCETSV